MWLSDIEKALSYEYEKVKNKGLTNHLIGFFLLLLYFYSIPKLFFYIYSSLPYYDQATLYFLGTFTVHTLAYWVINSIYLILYKLKLPSIEKHKQNSEPWPWEGPDGYERISHVLKVTFFNQFFMVPATLAVLSSNTKYDMSIRLPPTSEIVTQLAFFLLCEDAHSHWTHRILHWGPLYRWIHKTHHKLNVTFSMACEYANPIEFLISNSIAVGIGPLIYGRASVHYVTWFTWITFRLINTLDAHSGYDFPWMPFKTIPFSTNQQYHDYHHLKNLGNYSAFFSFWDMITGNQRTYLKDFKKVYAKKVD